MVGLRNLHFSVFQIFLFPWELPHRVGGVLLLRPPTHEADPCGFTALTHLTRGLPRSGRKNTNTVDPLSTSFQAQAQNLSEVAGVSKENALPLNNSY